VATQEEKIIPIRDFTTGGRQLTSGPRGRVQAARFYLARRCYDDALAECEAALHLNPCFAPAHLLLGWINAVQGRFSEALEAYTAAVKHDPSIRGAQYLIASAYRELGSYDEAILACQKELELDPRRTAAQVLIGELLFVQKRYEEAAAAFKAAL